ncbi:hypothetical protein [Leuconostoc holzapfelii]|nr:hypothetical protein [Leuconostoc holzapfelii]
MIAFLVAAYPDVEEYELTDLKRETDEAEKNFYASEDFFRI